MANLLEGRFRAQDMRGRLGQNLFAMSFFGVESSTMVPVVRRAREAFEQLTFPDIGTASFSAGLASFPSAGQGLPEVLAAAEARLAAARSRQGGRAVIG